MADSLYGAPKSKFYLSEFPVNVLSIGVIMYRSEFINSRSVILGLILLLLIVRPGHAAPVTIQVDYAPPTPSSLTCSSSLTFLCTPELFSSYVSSTSPSLIFNLDDSQRAVNGTYDVSSSLSGPVWDSYQSTVALPGISASSFTANAIVQGGLVSDLLLNLGYSFLNGDMLLNYALTGNSGAYGAILTMSFTGVAGTAEATYAGIYDIIQPPAESGFPGVVPVSPVPEPETYAMLLTGLSLIGFTARRRKYFY